MHTTSCLKSCRRSRIRGTCLLIHYMHTTQRLHPFAREILAFNAFDALPKFPGVKEDQWQEQQRLGDVAFVRTTDAWRQCRWQCSLASVLTGVVFCYHRVSWARILRYRGS